MTDRRNLPDSPHVVAIIPALNEEQSIAKVLAAIPRPPVREVIVVDNGSTDETANVARRAGAHVVSEPRRGYGQACLAGIWSYHNLPGRTDIVVFLDGDYSDFPEDLPKLIAPIRANEADLVIGSRTIRTESRAALPPQARAGNRLACLLMWMLYGVRFTDLGPFRAIRADVLDELEMDDRDYGWTAEMQVKAVRNKLRIWEVPVRYRRRIGVSKVTGTLEGTLRAGCKILYTVCRHAL